MKTNNVSNSNRHTKIISKRDLCKTLSIFKNKVRSYKRCGKGRSQSNGRITCWNRGGGHKRTYRDLNSSTSFLNAIIIANSYDSFRNSFVSVGFDVSKKVFTRTLAVDKVGPGSLIQFFSNVISQKNLKLGHRTTLSQIPPGSLINQISCKNGSSKFARSAGVKGQLLQKGLMWSSVKLPSGRVLRFVSSSLATIGEVSNSQSFLQVLGKAGRSRNLGKRPVVRGVAMNAVDHPHGGKSNGGRLSVSPWGIPTKSGFYLKKKKKNEQI